MTALALLHRKVSGTQQLFQTATLFAKQSYILSRNESRFVPKRVLVLSKVSRYYYEKLWGPDLNESQLRRRLMDRGSDYDALLASHQNDKEKELATTNILKDLNIEYKVMNRSVNNLCRLSVDHNAFNWADLILPIGGDGTFLFSANLIFDNKKPIIGINSDPLSSEGYLMLPEKYTKDIRLIFELMKAGEYKFLMRSRIRTTLKGVGIWEPPFHMHQKWRVTGKERSQVKHADESIAVENKKILRFNVDDTYKDHSENVQPNERRLPWLALNEVFIGEALSARTSALDIRLGNANLSFKVKSCGLCASTGTGSTSWHRAINSLSPQTVDNIFRVGGIKLDSSINATDISSRYNGQLQFPADCRIAYTIRDMIVGRTLPSPKGIQPRGFCQKLIIRSHCFDAGLVLDGGIAVPFNDGTVAVLEIHPEDSLRTIILPE
ncbi:NAD kinase 2, mitochondrial isoform X2 [Athalia rosae]|uniref:NAD kinase 2, mitochondrial isoform X2 n=1 Tax=Athalia rosae TaxID=37344 RepID=UPI0020337D53|nr:NAD kinase 2, mitochondrial isoform X2 [Athalia rosae]